jgi:hypothetical protein
MFRRSKGLFSRGGSKDIHDGYRTRLATVGGEKLDLG